MATNDFRGWVQFVSLDGDEASAPAGRMEFHPLTGRSRARVSGDHPGFAQVLGWSSSEGRWTVVDGPRLADRDQCPKPVLNRADPEF